MTTDDIEEYMRQKLLDLEKDLGESFITPIDNRM